MRERLQAVIARIRVSHKTWLTTRPTLPQVAPKPSQVAPNPTSPSPETDDDLRQRFRRAAERLRERTLRDFRIHEWPRFQRLNESLQQDCGLPVPALSVCGHGTAEIRFTKLLGWYLDHRNPHGLRGLLGQALGEEIFEKKHPKLDACTVEVELYIGNTTTRAGREKANCIDLHLQFDDAHVYIEQKIGSAEGQNQLRNYADCLASSIDIKRDRLVFLTPEGRKPSDERWDALSYREIFRLLAQVLRRHALSPVARYNLKALLWDLMLGPIAQSTRWVQELEGMVAKVARNPDREYINLSRWLARYGLGVEERQILLDIAEA